MYLIVIMLNTRLLKPKNVLDWDQQLFSILKTSQWTWLETWLPLPEWNPTSALGPKSSKTEVTQMLQRSVQPRTTAEFTIFAIIMSLALSQDPYCIKECASHLAKVVPAPKTLQYKFQQAPSTTQNKQGWQEGPGNPNTSTLWHNKH